MMPNHHDWERADLYAEDNARLRKENAAMLRVLEAVANKLAKNEPMDSDLYSAIIAIAKAKMK